MKIDAHQHFWKYSVEEYDWLDESMAHLQRDFLPTDLAPILAEADFDGCVAVQARQTEEENKFLLDLSESSDIIKGVVGWIDLRAVDLEDKLGAYTDAAKMKGFRHVVQGEPDDRFIIGEEFVRGVKLIGLRDYTYDILIFEKQLPATVEFVNKLPEQRLVIDHIAKPDVKTGMSNRWKEAMIELGNYDHVHCKLSGMITEADWKTWKPDDLMPYIEVVFKAFGPERLMVGSDWPVCLAAADSHADTINVVERFTKGMSEEDMTAIYGGNACSFYNLW